MTIYETTFIINPQTDDTSIDREVKSVAELITKNGGNILHEDRLGTRRLAYQINGLTQGYYAGFIFEGSKEVLSQLDHHFKLGEACLRHLTVLCERDIKALTEPKEAATADKKEAKSADAAAKPEASGVATTSQSAPAKQTTQVEDQPVKPVETVKEKGSIKADKPTSFQEDEEL